jgi:hydrocephalus-inducing protein
MAVAYEWSFLEEAPMLNEQDEIDHLDNKGKKKKKKTKKALPINEVFDILPVSGILQPGQTENVEFTFYAGNGINYSGMAVCSVDGGPDYDVPIQGDSHHVAYRLSTEEINFGEVPYNESTTKDFFIENFGKVPFEFNINLSTLSRPGVVECTPITGKVIAGEKFKISVKFYPGIPDNIHEIFLVECGHFPAQRFTLDAIGIYPGALISLPRVDHASFQERFDATKEALEAHKIDYSAMFKGAEAVKHMPVIPKFTDKSVAVIKDPVALEIEAEVDRKTLCEKLIEKM